SAGTPIRILFWAQVFTAAVESDRHTPGATDTVRLRCHHVHGSARNPGRFPAPFSVCSASGRRSFSARSTPAHRPLTARSPPPGTSHRTGARQPPRHPADDPLVPEVHTQYVPRFVFPHQPLLAAPQRRKASFSFRNRYAVVMSRIDREHRTLHPPCCLSRNF